MIQMVGCLEPWRTRPRGSATRDLGSCTLVSCNWCSGVPHTPQGIVSLKAVERGHSVRVACVSTRTVTCLSLSLSGFDLEGLSPGLASETTCRSQATRFAPSRIEQVRSIASCAFCFRRSLKLKSSWNSVYTRKAVKWFAIKATCHHNLE
jgi:hypothetical protein